MVYKPRVIIKCYAGQLSKILIPILLMHISFLAMSQQIIPLYRHIPNAVKTANQEKETHENGGILIISNVSQPTLTVYLPEQSKANGTGIIICPGGGYGVLAADHEGYAVAKRFNDMGIAAFVLKYRIPNDATMTDKSIGPLQDAQRAIQLVRMNAVKWHVNPGKIGIMGFSAGGHLAASAGTHYEKPLIKNEKDIDLRPDFMILIYPVISFTDSIGHLGSRDNLLGKNPGEEKIKYYSNELQVTEKTPPAFLVHSIDDDVVKVENAKYFADALTAKGIKNELYLYQNGGHGYGMTNPTSPVLWMDKLSAWLELMQLK